MCFLLESQQIAPPGAKYLSIAAGWLLLGLPKAVSSPGWTSPASSYRVSALALAQLGDVCWTHFRLPAPFLYWVAPNWLQYSKYALTGTRHRAHETLVRMRQKNQGSNLSYLHLLLLKHSHHSEIGLKH